MSGMSDARVGFIHAVDPMTVKNEANEKWHQNWKEEQKGLGMRRGRVHGETLNTCPGGNLKPFLLVVILQDVALI